MKLAVLNPSGKDAEQTFANGAGEPASHAHPPINYHAYAACTGGSFHRKITAIPPGTTAVLLLLRRDLQAALAALEQLKSEGKIVAVSLKESGAHQVADRLSDSTRLALFRKICALADGCLSSTPNLVSFYRGAVPVKREHRVEFIPTPYPVDDERWDFSVPVTERHGIFIGTREFNVPSRNHLAALLAIRKFSKQTGEKITVINCDGRAGETMLAAAGLRARLTELIAGPMPYPDYLRIVARHKIMFQLDRSEVPGQVAGDALLCRIPCLGGDGAIERLAFSNLCGFGKNTDELVAAATRALTDNLFYRRCVDDSQNAAHQLISFNPVAKKLADFYARIADAS